MSDTVHDQVLRQVQAALEQPKAESATKLLTVMNLVTTYRAWLVANTVISRADRTVQDGPFKGMQLLDHVTNGCYAPKLLGTYERALHPVLQEMTRRDYDIVINVGCAEGYYAVGLARMLPNAQIIASDLDSGARTACARLAALNSVTERVQVSDASLQEILAALISQRVLVICDIEGGEDELLNPTKIPQLTKVDILVEAHDVFIPGLSNRLSTRFEPTHEIQRTESMPMVGPVTQLADLADLDQLLAGWEWRAGPTPWLSMRSRHM